MPGTERDEIMASMEIYYTAVCSIDDREFKGKYTLDGLSKEEENAYKKMKLLRYSIEDVSDLQAAFARAGNAIKDILNKKLSGEYDVDTLQSELKLELCIEENLDTYTIPELDPTVAEASLRFLCSQKSVDYDDIHGYVLENEDYYNGEPELLYLAYRVARDTGRQDCVDRFIEDYLEEITGSYVIYCDTPGCEFKREFASDGDRLVEDEVRDVLWEFSDKIYNYKIDEDDVRAMGSAFYDDINTDFQNGWGYTWEEPEIYLKTLDKDGKEIDTETVDPDKVLSDAYDECQAESGFGGLVDEYIVLAFKKFEKSSSWHFGLVAGDKVIKDISDWPEPVKDSKGHVKWVKNGIRFIPTVWFGPGKAKIDKHWKINGAVYMPYSRDFWFGKDQLKYLVEVSYSGFSFDYHSYEFNMEKIRNTCPVKFDETDTKTSLTDKIVQFFLAEYKNGRKC